MVSASPAGWVYEGWVRHRRFAPVPHAFRYRICQLMLDLDRLDEAFRGRWFWSARRPALAWFRRSDHHGDPGIPLADATRDLVEARTGRRPRGPVRLLTHLRYAGYVMNPVSFYYCWDESDRALEAIVAEVHNTPWGERHCYVLDMAEGGVGEPAARTRRFRFGKDFHVSPFMGMNQTYDWRFARPDERLAVHMENLEEGRIIFDATMVLERRDLTGANLRRVLVRYPFMTVQVIAAIYWQAFRLWIRRCPLYAHPGRRSSLPAPRTPGDSPVAREEDAS